MPVVCLWNSPTPSLLLLLVLLHRTSRFGSCRRVGRQLAADRPAHAQQLAAEGEIVLARARRSFSVTLALHGAHTASLVLFTPLQMDEVSTPELAEVFAINAMAPYILNARLKPLMTKGREIPADMPVRRQA